MCNAGPMTDYLEPLYGRDEVDLNEVLPRRLRDEYAIVLDEFVRVGMVKRVFRAGGRDYQRFMDVPEDAGQIRVFHKLIRTKPTVIVLYGEMGAGKNYQGSKLAEALDLPFLDGDTALSPELATNVKSFKPLAPAQLEHFVHRDLFKAILKSASPNGIVVGQALYLREMRDRLIARLRGLGFAVEARRIKVPFWQNLRQLWSRPRGIRWVLYWLLNKPFFQD